MKEIVKRLLENHNTTEESGHIPESGDFDEYKKDDITENQEELPEEELQEDWRDGKFTEQDLKRYLQGTDEKAQAIAYSLRKMREKHPEYKKEFDSAIRQIRNIFANLV